VRAQSKLDHNSAPIGAPATALTPVDRGAQVAVLADGGDVVLKPIQLGGDFGDRV